MIDEKDLLKIMTDVEKIQAQSKISFDHMDTVLKELKEETKQQTQVLQKIERLLEDCISSLKKQGESKLPVALVWIVVGQIATIILTLFELIYKLSNHP